MFRPVVQCKRDAKGCSSSLSNSKWTCPRLGPPASYMDILWEKLGPGVENIQRAGWKRDAGLHQRVHDTEVLVSYSGMYTLMQLRRSWTSRHGMGWEGGASDIFIWAAVGNHMLARFPNFWLFAPELHWLQSKVWWFLASGVFSSAIAHTVALLAWSWIKLRWETRIKRRVKGTGRLAEGSLLLKDIRASVSISFRQIGPRI